MMTQEKALAILKSGRNVFLTGSAGAGKTYTLNRYIGYLRDHDIPVAVTASTGIAATHMNGMTIHSWSGIGVKDTLLPADLARMKERKYLREKMDEVKVLIIDEISMLHRQQLEMVNMVLKSFRGNDQAFGGIQVVFCGDFFQLPPVGKQGEEPRDKFAFMSPAWLEADPCICYLSEQYRQKENSLNRLLNHIREGRVDETDMERMRAASRIPGSEEREITRLYTHNADVDRINREQLNRLSSEAHLFTAEVKGGETLREILKKSVLTDEELELRTGARVMFIRNNYERNYMNGTTGVISGFSEDGYPLVRTANDLIEAIPEEWSIQDEKGKMLASFLQVPLRLAWAITVHKSQGMTLDAASADLSSTFERGQGYVALSRLRDMESLHLTAFNAMALETDPLVVKADRRFRELSAEAANKLSVDELKHSAGLFLELCAPKRKTAKGRKNTSARQTKVKKESTYDQTLTLLKEGRSLEEISGARSLSKGTIIGHLSRLKEKEPGLSLESIRPEQEMLGEILEVVNGLKSADEAFAARPSMTPVHAKLGGKYSFDEIRLAMLFTDQ